MQIPTLSFFDDKELTTWYGVNVIRREEAEFDWIREKRVDESIVQVISAFFTPPTVFLLFLSHLRCAFTSRLCQAQERPAKGIWYFVVVTR